MFFLETLGNTDTINLPDPQIELAESMIKIKKPIILVYYGGRPRIITDIVESIDGVILAFLPGNKGGEAVADIIFGDYNPNGKLPITYPRVTNGFITYDFKPSENFDVNIPENQWLFPFGHGLSYTSFEYSNLRLDKYFIDFTKGETNLTVSVDIENTGELAGKHTVILYINDEYASIARPAKQVRGFKKVYLKANEKTSVSFVLDVKEHLSFIDQSNKLTLESGYFNVYVDDLKTKFQLKLPQHSVHLDSSYSNTLKFNFGAWFFSIYAWVFSSNTVFNF